MAGLQIPIDALTSRFGLNERFDSLRQHSFASRFANLRPVSEFFDIKRLSKPADFGEVRARINYNLGYFSSNYAVVVVVLSIYSLLTNFLLLFVILLVVLGMHGIGKLEGRDLEIGQTSVSSSQLYSGLTCAALFLGLWASPIQTILWLVGASSAIILGHASVMDKPIEDAFSQETV